MLDDGFDFSFSGLKTAVVNHVGAHPDDAVPTSRRRSRRRSSTCSSTQARARADEAGRQGRRSAGAWRPTRPCGARSERRRRAAGPPCSCPAGPLHRQRGDDRGAAWYRLRRRRPATPLDAGARPDLSLGPFEPMLAGGRCWLRLALARVAQCPGQPAAPDVLSATCRHAEARQEAPS